MNRVSTRGGGFGLSRFTSNGNQYTGAVPGLPLFFLTCKWLYLCGFCLVK